MQAQGQAQVLGQVLVPEQVLEQALVPEPVLEQALVPEPVRLVQGLVVLEWVPDQVQALVKVDLDQVAIKVRTAMVLVMELVMPVLAQQTVQALAQATALVRAVMDRAAASNANPLKPLKCSPHPPLSG
jgi:hypothetical protein